VQTGGQAGIHVIRNMTSTNSDPHVLTSWKEIAAYLGKGVRTVQRWERELSLPVRRPYGMEKHVIVALPEELDNWMRTRMVPRENNGARPAVAQTPARPQKPKVDNDVHAAKLERMQALLRVMQERANELNRHTAELLARTSELKLGSSRFRAGKDGLRQPTIAKRENT
jgi:hypothetical protein